MAINSLTSGSRGISGLASGMDTQSMVDKMLQGTQSKIDAKTQQKAVLAYKQSMYRDVATQLKAFQSTFFSYTNGTSNLLSNSFYKTMVAQTNSKFFKASATSDAAAGKFTVNNIKRLATTHKEVSAVNASGKLEGQFNADKLRELSDKLTNSANDVKITIGSGSTASTVSVSMAELAGKSAEQAARIMQDKLTAGGADAKVEYLNGKMQIFAGDGKSEVSIGVSELGSTMLNGVVKGAGGTSFNFDSAKVLPTYNINMDGVSKNITVNPLIDNGDGTYGTIGIDELARQLNEGIGKAFGAGITVRADNVKNTISFDVASNLKTSKLTVNSNDKTTMDAIGIKQGQSNKVLTGAAIKDINFSTAISGNIQKFTINGVDFSFDSSKSMSDIMADINTSKAGVKVTYDAYTDRFSMESTTQGALASGSGNAFTMSQSEGNLLTSMFGVNASGSYSSNVLTNAPEISTKFDPSTFSFGGGDVTINFAGQKKTYTLAAASTPQALIDELNAKIKVDFPAKETIGGVETDSQAFSFKLNATGDGVDLRGVGGSVDMSLSVEGEGLKSLGFSQAVDGSTTMGEMGFEEFEYEINGTKIRVMPDTTLDEFMQQMRNEGINVDLDTIGQKPFIRLAGVSIPMIFPTTVSDKLFGTNVTPGDGQLDAANKMDVKEAGQNALATINGNEIERTSNTFTVDGVSITLTATTDEAEDVDISQDTDKIFDTVKKFVEEYNKLVDGINDILSADTSYKKYPPLTAAEKSEMSDKEIEAWEEKSKGGLLRGDSTLTGVLSGMRGTLYTKPGGGLALYDLGITSNDFYGNKDNLAIADEANLRAKIAENPQAIAKLFTDPDSGLAVMMDKAIDKAAKVSSTAPGSLVAMAGAKGTPDNDSSIARQMKLIDDSLNALNDKYATEHERYWKQFNAMEQAISSLNSQSSWLSQQFAG